MLNLIVCQIPLLNKLWKPRKQNEIRKKYFHKNTSKNRNSIEKHLADSDKITIVEDHNFSFPI